MAEIRQESLAELTRLLTSLEQRLHDPATRRDPALAAPLLADDFREFGSSGRVYDKPAMLEALAEEGLDQPEAIESTN